MRLDAHQHFWRYSPATHPWIDASMAGLTRDFLPADLLPLLRASGLDGCIAVQAEQSVRETEWLLGLARQHDFIRGVVGWVYLCSPACGEDLARLAADPRLRGVRHIAGRRRRTGRRGARRICGRISTWRSSASGRRD